MDDYKCSWVFHELVQDLQPASEQKCASTKHYIVEKKVTKLFGQLITFLRLGRTNSTIVMGDGIV